MLRTGLTLVVVTTLQRAIAGKIIELMPSIVALSRASEALTSRDTMYH